MKAFFGGISNSRLMIFFKYNLLYLIMVCHEIRQIYKKLYKEFGPQDWWPVIGNKTNSKFEIMIGTILTQNTSWKNVEKAIINLSKEKLISPIKIISSKKIKKCIHPAGYYNQKYNYLIELSRWYLKNKDKINQMKTKELKEELLSIKGVGPETADSIILYAFNRPVFVVDAYTKRFLERHKLIQRSEMSDYYAVQNIFHRCYSKLSQDEKVRIYKEYHALIVELGKRYCRKKPNCDNCPIKYM